MNDMSTLTKLTNPFSLEKRFENDFEVIQVLGKRENSLVYKVRNQLDNSLYAVREISFNIKDYETESLQKEINNVLREVRLHAKLKNECIVNYNYSWIEVKLRQTRDLNQNVEIIDRFPHLRKESSEILSDKTSVSSVENKASLNKITINDSEYNVDEIENIIIYVQMELCKESLHNYLERRNEEINIRLLDNLLKEKEILQIFNSICTAVNYLHYEGKIIHNNLSTKGVYFSEDGKIKIGNFCFAKKIPSSKSLKFDSKKPRNSYLEIDISSLGKILIELIYPFQKLKVKADFYDEILKGNVPSFIKEQFPIIYKLLDMILNPYSIKKPNCKFILSFIQEYFKNVYKENHEYVNKIGRRRVLSEDNETEKKLEVYVKLDGENNHMERMWIKIVNNERLLFFTERSSSKAIYCYKIKECEISGRFLEKSIKGKYQKSLSHSCVDIPESQNKKQLFDQLNFQIEIDNPYLSKCLLQCESFLKSLDLYRELNNM